MKIAIASGKGGTGKTTLAVSLALALAEHQKVALLDCDVEEPNARLFLTLTNNSTHPVTMRVPEVDESRCIGCGACARACQFNAIAATKDAVILFSELCHACGRCLLACPVAALQETAREVGVMEHALQGDLAFFEGRLHVGMVMATPVIRAVLKAAPAQVLSIIDCPPGTACPMVAAVREADAVLLVTEPTPFGLHDLKLAVETTRLLKKPLGVILNRATPDDDSIQKYCIAEGIPLMLEVPDRRDVAEGYSRGVPLINMMPELKPALCQMLTAVTAWCAKA